MTTATTEAKEGFVLNIGQIMATIPHRYPFLLVDRILELEPGVRAVGLKNVTMNEDFFNGHFPGNPIMPGVLIVEHAAQVGGVLLLTSTANKGKLALFASIEEMKFRRQVVPGDQLVTEVTILKVGSRAGRVRAVCRVGEQVAAEGEFTFVLVPDSAQATTPGKEG
ncbi:MAG: 3-hydroxyacyl-(acyl-carrier-protein) dehydratase FabZ [bacterium ADurb.Bin429]|nr:MAG: 3-hydroxyacyl-(acyl-carrier-protein) dehydratase FabZ [bacterium ADurb.Bin429]